jgi:hypothetical protein
VARPLPPDRQCAPPTARLGNDIDGKILDCRSVVVAMRWRSSRTRFKWLLAVALAVFCVLCWLLFWMLDRRAVLRARLEVERLGDRIQVVEGGSPWITWLVDKRYFDTVVEVNLADLRQFDRSWISSFRDLESLILFNAAITEDDFSRIKSLHRLRHLNLVRTDIAGPELDHLAELPGLEELRLGPIRDDVVRHLRGCTNLRVLRIMLSPDFSDRGLQALPSLPNLKTLYLLRTGTSESGVRQLQQRFPDLEIVHQGSN